MTNYTNTVLYIGVTNSLARRVYEHKNKLSPHDSFTKRYNVNKLVFYEQHQDIRNAIDREKQIKSWNRKRKVNLINSMNSDWQDLSGEIYF